MGGARSRYFRGRRCEGRDPDDQRCVLTVTRRADRLVVLAEHCTQIVP
jgi:hypothetical protein